MLRKCRNEPEQKSYQILLVPDSTPRWRNSGQTRGSVVQLTPDLITYKGRYLLRFHIGFLSVHVDGTYIHMYGIYLIHKLLTIHTDHTSGMVSVIYKKYHTMYICTHQCVKSHFSGDKWKINSKRAAGR